MAQSGLLVLVSSAEARLFGDDAATRIGETREALNRETDVYRRQFRAPKR